MFCARAGLVALGLPVLVKVRLGIAAPAFSTVLGREEFGAVAVFCAFLDEDIAE